MQGLRLLWITLRQTIFGVEFLLINGFDLGLTSCNAVDGFHRGLPRNSCPLPLYDERRGRVAVVLYDGHRGERGSRQGQQFGLLPGSLGLKFQMLKFDFPCCAGCRWVESSAGDDGGDEGLPDRMKSADELRLGFDGLGGYYVAAGRFDAAGDGSGFGVDGLESGFDGSNGPDDAGGLESGVIRPCGCAKFSTRLERLCGFVLCFFELMLQRLVPCLQGFQTGF